jgi:hypothetical protein
MMPDEDTYNAFLESCIKEFFHTNKTFVFILVDAYDELLSSKGEKFEEATEQREKVHSFLSLLEQTGCAKILITTRPQHRQELRNNFPSSIVADVHGDLNDMRTYLSKRLARSTLPRALKDEILDKLLLENEIDKWSS